MWKLLGCQLQSHFVIGCCCGVFVRQVLELPVEVTAEDVISIKGHQAELACKDLVAPVNSSENLAQNLKDQRAKQLSEKLAFLGTWQDSGNQKDLKVSANLRCDMHVHLDGKPQMNVQYTQMGEY